LAFQASADFIFARPNVTVRSLKVSLSTDRAEIP